MFRGLGSMGLELGTAAHGRHEARMVWGFG